MCVSLEFRFDERYRSTCTCSPSNPDCVCSAPAEGRGVSEPGAGLRPGDGVQSRQTLQPSQTDPAHGLCQGGFIYVFVVSFFFL